MINKKFVAAMTVYSAICALVLAWYFLSGRHLIESMYNGAAHPIFNGIISCQSWRFVEYYYHLALQTILTTWIIGLIAITAWFFWTRCAAALERHHRSIVLIAYSIFVVYTGATFFRPASLHYPVTQIDHAFHFTESIETYRHVMNAGRLGGYDPFLCAGMICTGIDNVWPAFFYIVFGVTGKFPFVYNVAFFLSMVLPPLMALSAGTLLRFSRINATVFFIGSMFLTLGFAPVRMCYFCGLYGFALAAWLSVFLLGATRRFLEHPRIITLALLTAAGILTVFIHPLSTVLFPILLAPYAIAHYRLLRPKTARYLAVSGAVAFAATLAWLHPVITAKTFPITAVTAGLQTTPALLFETVKGDRAFLMLLILFILSIVSLLRQKMRRQAFFYGTVFLSFFCIAFFGTQLGLGLLEPSRFIIPCALVSWMAVADVFESHMAKRRWIIPAGIGILFILLRIAPLPFDFGLTNDDNAARFLSFFNEKGKSSGRILIQTSPYARPYFNSYLASYLAYLTGRGTTASEYPGCGPLFTQFIDNTVFQKDLSRFPLADMASYLDLYAIRHIVTFSAEADRYFSGSGLAEKVFEHNAIRIFAVNSGKETYCHHGTADITPEYDRISVRHADSSITILKYHYFPGMHIRPEGIPIIPVRLLDDPTPFIKVLNGSQRDFTIRY